MPWSKNSRQSSGTWSTPAGKSGGDSGRYPGMGKPMKSLHRILKFGYPFLMTSPTPWGLWDLSCGITATSRSTRMGQQCSLNIRNWPFCFLWLLKHMPCSRLPHSFGLMMTKPSRYWEQPCGFMSAQSSGFLRQERRTHLNCEMRFSHALTNSNLPSPLRSCSRLRRRNQPDGRKNLKKRRSCKHLKNPFRTTQREPKHLRSRSPITKGNTWNYKQLLPAWDNERLQRADQQIPHSPKHQLACRHRTCLPQEKPTLPYHPTVVQTQRLRLQFHKAAIGLLRSVHTRWPTSDKRHHHRQPHTSQSWIPRVPVSYPLTPLIPQYK